MKFQVKKRTLFALCFLIGILFDFNKQLLTIIAEFPLWMKGLFIINWYAVFVNMPIFGTVKIAVDILRRGSACPCFWILTASYIIISHASIVSPVVKGESFWLIKDDRKSSIFAIGCIFYMIFCAHNLSLVTFFKDFFGKLKSSDELSDTKSDITERELIERYKQLVGDGHKHIIDNQLDYEGKIESPERKTEVFYDSEDSEKCKLSIVHTRQS